MFVFNRNPEAVATTTKIIKLNGRNAVEIQESEWPIIGHTQRSKTTHMSQGTSIWTMEIRQHKDGRTIVYANYHYSDPDNNVESYGGKFFFQNRDINHSENIVKSAREVAISMRKSNHFHFNDCLEWDQIAEECIMSLPPERI